MSEHLYTILWFVALVLTSYWVIMVNSRLGMAIFFREGSKWWHAPARYGALLLYSVVVLYNPWR
jgi:hypothetical protein